jgi:excinuclease UvrABC ATPase subunit
MDQDARERLLTRVGAPVSYLAKRKIDLQILALREHLEDRERAARQLDALARALRDLADEIDLDKQKKHTIEIIVDRLVVKPEVKGRLTESVETALDAAEGLVVVDVDGKKDLLFSRNLACVACGISIGELAPRMFSFNSPYGACPECDGLGVRKSFDRDKLLRDPDASIRGGAIAWGDATWHQVFESGVADVPAGYVERLGKILEGMRDRHNVRLHFVGHADSQPLHHALPSLRIDAGATGERSRQSR